MGLRYRGFESVGRLNSDKQTSYSIMKSMYYMYTTAFFGHSVELSLANTAVPDEAALPRMRLKLRRMQSFEATVFQPYGKNAYALCGPHG